MITVDAPALAPEQAGEAGPPVAPTAPTARVAAALDRTWAWITGLRPSLAVGLLLGLTLVRSGVWLEENGAVLWVNLARAFPAPLSDWRTNSVTGPALGHLVGVETTSEWLTLHLFVLIAVVGLLAALVAGRFATRETRTVAAVWLALGSIAPALTQRIGSYDVYVVAGVALAVWGRRRPAVVAGGVLLGATSAEQGLVGLAAAGLVAVALTDAPQPGLLDRVRSAAELPHLALAAAALTVTRLVVLAAHRSTDVLVPTRAEVFGTYLGDSLGNTRAAGLSGVYAYLGLGWGLVLLAALVLGWDRRTLAVVLVGLVAVPASVTMTTLDGTRVFAMVSMAAYLVVLGRLADATGEGRVDRRFVRRATAAALLVAPLLPALMTAPSGDPHFVMPF